VHNNKLYEKFVEKRKAALVYWDKGGSPRTDSLWKEWSFFYELLIKLIVVHVEGVRY